MTTVQRKGLWNVLQVVIVACLLAGCQATLSKEMCKLGFKRLQPPRTRIEPGTLVVLEKLPEGATGVRPVCWLEQAFPGLAAAPEDPTFDQDLAKRLEKTFKLEAEYMEKIKANAKYKGVKEIRLTISNASVPGSSDADLLGKIDARSAKCQEAVRRREVEKEQTVYTVLSVLRADVTYKVNFDSETSGAVTVPKEVLKGLKVELDATVVNTSDNTIKGNGLHWGIEPDVFKVVPALGGAPGPPVVDGLQRLSADGRKRLVKDPVVLLSTVSDADLL